MVVKVSTASAVPLQPNWLIQKPAGFHSICLNGGQIYALSGKSLVAVSWDGRELWTVGDLPQYASNLQPHADGVIVDGEDTMVCVSPQGSLLWRASARELRSKKPRSKSPAVIVLSETIDPFDDDWDKTVYSFGLDENGVLTWKFQLPPGFEISCHDIVPGLGYFVTGDNGEIWLYDHLGTPNGRPTKMHGFADKIVPLVAGGWAVCCSSHSPDGEGSRSWLYILGSDGAIEATHKGEQFVSFLGEFSTGDLLTRKSTLMESLPVECVGRDGLSRWAWSAPLRLYSLGLPKDGQLVFNADTPRDYRPYFVVVDSSGKLTRAQELGPPPRPTYSTYFSVRPIWIDGLFVTVIDDSLVAYPISGDKSGD